LPRITPRDFITNLAWAVGAALIGGALPAIAEPPPTKPVRIYLLSGQSNMTGRGKLGDLNKPASDQKATLVRYIKDSRNFDKYRFLHEGPNKTPEGWTVRDDVFVTLGRWPHDGTKDAGKHGGLAPGFGGIGNKGFGPELGIGHVLGDFHQEPVVLVKIAFGANNLAKNFRPPGLGGTLGDKYPLVVKAMHDAIEHLPEIIPAYKRETGYEIAGFFWNQGENDCNPEFSLEYGKNMVNLIKDLRKEFKAPDMKVVIAVTGYGGWNLEADSAPSRESHQRVITAQLALPLRPEFKTNVATVETRDFWRPNQEFGGTKEGIHWNGNGESYWLMGDSMGREMVKLHQAEK
jgi:alpha-galactosidase